MAAVPSVAPLRTAATPAGNSAYAPARINFPSSSRRIRLRFMNEINFTSTTHAAGYSLILGDATYACLFSLFFGVLSSLNLTCAACSSGRALPPAMSSLTLTEQSKNVLLILAPSSLHLF